MGNYLSIPQVSVNLVSIPSEYYGRFLSRIIYRLNLPCYPFAHNKCSLNSSKYIFNDLSFNKRYAYYFHNSKFHLVHCLRHVSIYSEQKLFLGKLLLIIQLEVLQFPVTNIHTKLIFWTRFNKNKEIISIYYTYMLLF